MILESASPRRRQARRADAAEPATYIGRSRTSFQPLLIRAPPEHAKQLDLSTSGRRSPDIYLSSRIPRPFHRLRGLQSKGLRPAWVERTTARRETILDREVVPIPRNSHQQARCDPSDCSDTTDRTTREYIERLEKATRVVGGPDIKRFASLDRAKHHMALLCETHPLCKERNEGKLLGPYQSMHEYAAAQFESDHKITAGAAGYMTEAGTGLVADAIAEGMRELAALKAQKEAEEYEWHGINLMCYEVEVRRKDEIYPGTGWRFEETNKKI
ncbi:hypothetical protein B0H16DRAFT_1482124 [Mycena metata]|uniref:Uncharacterized protein n=1 Tax=Mycena metata TaxID=1033252 RepID=A0AAD7M8S6_9AGAR|nr:hypothetical protein B0H16DRAFT_1482124 [Mycena metata]